MMKHIKIAAGLAHINYGKLTQLVREAEAAGVDYIHSDAADMHDLQNMNVIFIRFPWTKCLLNKFTLPVQTC